MVAGVAGTVGLFTRMLVGVGCVCIAGGNKHILLCLPEMGK